MRQGLASCDGAAGKPVGRSEGVSGRRHGPPPGRYNGDALPPVPRVSAARRAASPRRDRVVARDVRSERRRGVFFLLDFGVLQRLWSKDLRLVWRGGRAAIPRSPGLSSVARYPRLSRFEPRILSPVIVRPAISWTLSSERGGKGGGRKQPRRHSTGAASFVSPNLGKTQAAAIVAVPRASLHAPYLNGEPNHFEKKLEKAVA